MVEHEVAGASDGVPTSPSAPWQQPHVLFTFFMFTFAPLWLLVRFFLGKCKLPHGNACQAEVVSAAARPGERAEARVGLLVKLGLFEQPVKRASSLWDRHLPISKRCIWLCGTCGGPSDVVRALGTVVLL